jgi:hypothetical protein
MRAAKTMAILTVRGKEVFKRKRALKRRKLRVIPSIPILKTFPLPRASLLAAQKGPIKAKIKEPTLIAAIILAVVTPVFSAM